MSDCVWVTDAMVNLKNTYQFVPHVDYFDENLQKERDSSAKYLEAKRLLPEERRPAEAELERVTHTIDPLPHVVSNGYLIVSDTFKNIADRFDLGSTAFDPVVLYGFKRKARFEPDYNYLNITETKSTVDLVASKGLWALRFGAYSFSPSESDIVVNSTAISGVDLWMDPALYGAVFLSERLYSALDNEGLLAGLECQQCSVSNA